MNETLIALIDEQLQKLQKVRSLIVESAPAPKRGRPGRPKGSTNAATPKPAATPGKRTMSAEGKARIAAAQKKRWAAVRKAAK